MHQRFIKRFGVTAASAEVIRRRLNGPTRGGAPFMALIQADDEWYEQMLVNSLGPVELWAFSTSPQDVALRSRLYQRVGPAEARRRPARVFPDGSAKDEIERRKQERRRGRGAGAHERRAGPGRRAGGRARPGHRAAALRARDGRGGRGGVGRTATPI